LTEDLALEQAARADREIASGNYRGPLHGIPWGVKDLFATKGIPTTWGLERFKNRVIDTDATVVQRLEAAGAVLIAKLSLGELATGDRWYGGRTRNPWNHKRGSGGSSAGPASAVAAGLVGFSIGTETNESLVGPAMVCGVNGLRPTFGRVSRYGAMTVSWSYDKIGPMCRSAEDCAIVLDAICGPDDIDHSVIDLPFNWDPYFDIKKLRVGYIKGLFDLIPENEWVASILAAHKEALKRIEAMGANIIEIKNTKHDYLANLIQVSSLGMMVEAAAAHEGLALDMREKVFSYSDWAKRFRWTRYVPAVDYVQANRVRSLLIEEVDKIFQRVDVLIGRVTLSALQSNITGHPELVIPHGLDKNGMPISIILTGKLFGESALIKLAHTYQMETGYHQIHPDLK
jgi:Asp-tRNA(Asn)/Glu-tRNA(Gln) amidotransferase A subunit family amidase